MVGRCLWILGVVGRYPGTQGCWGVPEVAGGCAQGTQGCWGCAWGYLGHQRCAQGSQACLGVLRGINVPGGSWGRWGSGGFPGDVGGGLRVPRMVPGGPGALASPPLLLPQRCLRRILQGLQHYRDLLGSEIFKDNRLPQLVATLDRLLGVVQVSDVALPLPCARDSGTPGPCAR